MPRGTPSISLLAAALVASANALHPMLVCSLHPMLVKMRGGTTVATATLDNMHGVVAPTTLEDSFASTAVVDASIDRAVALSTEDEIILQFKPKARWLWRQMRGTVLEVTWGSCVVNMAVSTVVAATIRFGLLSHVPAGTWPLFTAPDPTHPVIARLLCLNVLWSQLASLSTFIITFFLSQAYSYWRTQLGLVRSLQGRINDISFLTSTFAARDENGDYTPGARKVLDDTARNVRLLHILFWAGIDESLSPLRSDEGLQRLSQRGVLNERELHTLKASGARPTKRHEVVLQWILVRMSTAGGGSGCEDRPVLGGAGFEQSMCETCKQLRAACGTVPDQMVERMPLAYVHIVHVLIDLLLFLAPFALYPKAGALAAPLSGVLTLFYRGLLELSKSFLDPFGNEGSRAQNIQSDVLLTENNRNSNHWWRAGQRMPFDVVKCRWDEHGDHCRIPAA